MSTPHPSILRQPQDERMEMSPGASASVRLGPKIPLALSLSKGVAGMSHASSVHPSTGSGRTDGDAARGFGLRSPWPKNPARPEPVGGCCQGCPRLIRPSFDRLRTNGWGCRPGLRPLFALSPTSLALSLSKSAVEMPAHRPHAPSVRTSTSSGRTEGPGLTGYGRQPACRAGTWRRRCCGHRRSGWRTGFRMPTSRWRNRR